MDCDRLEAVEKLALEVSSLSRLVIRRGHRRVSGIERHLRACVAALKEQIK